MNVENTFYSIKTLNYDYKVNCTLIFNDPVCTLGTYKIYNCPFYFMRSYITLA